jgi:hypothetical protein
VAMAGIIASAGVGWVSLSGDGYGAGAISNARYSFNCPNFEEDEGPKPVLISISVRN